MANFPLEQLLTYTPLQAMLIAINDVHGTQLNPRYVEVDKIVSSSGQNLVVRLKARTVMPNADENRFSGSGDITIKRLNLATIFPVPFVLDYFGEVVSHDVAKTITQRTGIVFDESDFDSVVLTPTSSILKASVNSLRWYGQMTIQKA
ncbi:hypothetical protein D3C87_1085010 [compost metagenome]